MTETREDPLTAARNRIRDNSALVCIAGMGYVGTELSEAVKTRYRVFGYDIDPSKANAHDAEDVREISNEGLLVLDDERIFERADVIAICVPTPLKERYDPDLGPLTTCAKSVGAHLRPGQLIIIESTTFPGATDDVIVPLIEKCGLKAGVDFGVAVSPERVDPGNKKYSVANTAKIVGAVTPDWCEITKEFYESFISAPVIKVSNCRTAEAVKTLENIYRNINIALVNELAIVFERLGIDVWETIAAASTKPFGYMPFYPGPGVGGHCIPLDPFYFYYKALDTDSTVWSIWLAEEINHRMPFHVVNLVKAALQRSNNSLINASVAVFGLAYKGDVSDVRESPALRIISILSEHQTKKIRVFDPYVEKVSVNGNEYVSERDVYQAAEDADCIVIVTNHTEFGNLDFSRLRRVVRKPLIVDSVNALEGVELEGWDYILLGCPRGKIR